MQPARDGADHQTPLDKPTSNRRPDICDQPVERFRYQRISNHPGFGEPAPWALKYPFL
jgi:hypothetical protein